MCAIGLGYGDNSSFQVRSVLVYFADKFHMNSVGIMESQEFKIKNVQTRLYKFKF